MATKTELAETWSATDFGSAELDNYAHDRLRLDTRRGVQVMAALSLLMQVSIAVLIFVRGLDSVFLGSTAIVAALSVHVLISAVFIPDVRAMHLLGMTFLILGALVVALLAHRIGDINIGMMAAVVMLFVMIPLVPWALREVCTVIGATYLLVTSSLISVPGRFDSESLLVLQLLLLGTAVGVLFVAGRNTLIRKHDIRSHFELENAHDKMELLSMQDALTGAWNRRFLDDLFPKIARQSLQNSDLLHVAVIDIDDFKGINDQFGHQVGDEILVALAEILTRHLGELGYLVRLGGDEFQIIYRGHDLDGLIEAAIADLQAAPVSQALASERLITLSAGIVTSARGELPRQDTMYRTADNALYAAKNRKANADLSSLARTGTWQL